METFYAKNRAEWRKWLEENHQTVKEIWLIYYKKHTQKPSIPYKDSLEEAICFGWIDGLIKRIDDEKYVRRFGPRKQDSIWSETNRKIAEKLMAANRIAKPGLEKIEEAKQSGKWEEAYNMQSKTKLPDDLKIALKANNKAWNNFNKFTNSYQSRYIYYINMAKREETRTKRIRMVVENAEKNIKPTI